MKVPDRRWKCLQNKDPCIGKARWMEGDQKISEWQQTLHSWKTGILRKIIDSILILIQNRFRTRTGKNQGFRYWRNLAVPIIKQDSTQQPQLLRFFEGIIKEWISRIQQNRIVKRMLKDKEIESWEVKAPKVFLSCWIVKQTQLKILTSFHRTLLEMELSPSHRNFWKGVQVLLAIWKHPLCSTEQAQTPRWVTSGTINPLYSRQSQPPWPSNNLSPNPNNPPPNNPPNPNNSSASYTAPVACTPAS